MTDCAKVFETALAAGNAALEAAKPTPMTVVGGGERYFVSEGACGFAWVAFKGNTKFGRWAKKVGVARAAYPTGMQYWVSQGGQSVDRKEAFARAFAAVLNFNGIEAYANYRMD